MIITDLKNFEHQIVMTPFMRKALDYLRQPNIAALPDGTIEIDGRRLFAIVQRYETLSTGAPKFEFHRKYIDVQYLVTGEEILGWAPADRMKITDPYNAEKDICFGVVDSGTMLSIHLKTGQLAVLYPEDGHAPRLAAGVPSPVMKIVVKVSV